MSKRKGTFSELLSDSMKLSKDVIVDSPFIYMTGNSEIMVENYKSIVEFSDTCIKVLVSGKVYVLSGAALSISYLNKEELVISGVISGILVQEV